MGPQAFDDLHCFFLKIVKEFFDIRRVFLGEGGVLPDEDPSLIRLVVGEISSSYILPRIRTSYSSLWCQINPPPVLCAHLASFEAKSLAGLLLSSMKADTPSHLE